MTSDSNNIIKWIQGNELVLAIPLQKVTVTPEGKVLEPYYPTANESIKVILGNTSVYRQSVEYTPTAVDGNVIKITDRGELRTGVYDVTILITSDDHSPRRSKWKHRVEIYDSNEAVLDAFDDFPDYGSGEIIDAAVFYFAKGDKGDKGDTGAQGIQGVKGDTGISVVSVEQVQTSEVSLGVNIIRVTLSNGVTSDFEVRNGAKPAMYVEDKTLYIK